MVCLNSGESELTALVGGACEGRNERPMEQDEQLFFWYHCLVHWQPSSAEIRGAKGCKSTHSTRGHEGLLHADLRDGTWTTHLEVAW